MRKSITLFVLALLSGWCVNAQISEMNQTEQSASQAFGGEMPACTDLLACNYNPEATLDNDACEYLSCSCGTAVMDMEVEMNCVDLETGELVFDNFGFGCEYPSDFNIAWNGNFDVGYLIPSSGAEAAYVDLPFCEITYQDALAANYVSDYGLADVYGLVPGNTFIVHTEDGNYYAVGDIQETDIQPTNISLDFAFRLIEPDAVGCMDETACNYDPAAVNDNGTCEFLSCAGCTIEIACNYNPNASIADYESCEFVSCRGCTYSDAENYNASATIDNGSCTYAACVTCMGDFNSDGFINSGDLVVFLGIYGGTCE
ncbi:MAG: hypothetical protein P8N19_06805 [Flavobacteriales bacterium]|nr:hypothetical protein [Flavobacteriales bacterium]